MLKKITIFTIINLGILVFVGTTISNDVELRKQYMKTAKIIKVEGESTVRSAFLRGQDLECFDKNDIFTVNYDTPNVLLNMTEVNGMSSLNIGGKDFLLGEVMVENHNIDGGCISTTKGNNHEQASFTL